MNAQDKDDWTLTIKRTAGQPRLTWKVAIETACMFVLGKVSKEVRIFLDGAVNTVHTAPWPHCPNRNVFSDRRNSLYDNSASFRCDGRLFCSLGPAAANALSPKVLCVRVTMHVPARCGSQLLLTSIGDKTAVVGQIRWRNARHRLMHECSNLEVNALAYW